MSELKEADVGLGFGILSVPVSITRILFAGIPNSRVATYAKDEKAV